MPFFARSYLTQSAAILWEAHAWREASAAFRTIVTRFPMSELAPYAANLYLDSLIQLEPTAHACVEEALNTLLEMADPHCLNPRTGGAESYAGRCDYLISLGACSHIAALEQSPRSPRRRELRSRNSMGFPSSRVAGGTGVSTGAFVFVGAARGTHGSAISAPQE